MTKPKHRAGGVLEAHGSMPVGVLGKDTLGWDGGVHRPHLFLWANFCSSFLSLIILVIYFARLDRPCSFIDLCGLKALRP